MANDYLMVKWRAAFKACDIGKSGTVDMDDARLFVDRFVQLHDVQGERAKDIRQTFLALWKELFQFEDETIDEEEFLRKTAADYNNDKKKYRERIERFMAGTCGIYDVNNDGYLSEEEYLVTLKCHGMKEFDRDYIQLYPQVPGKPGFVDLKVFAESWVQYMSNNDENNIEQEMPCLICYNVPPRDKNN